MKTSYADGGQLSASNAEVWNNWATVLKGIKWMFTPGALPLVSRRADWHTLSWMAQFVASIPKYEDNTITTARLSIEARSHLMQIAREEQIAIDCEERGILHYHCSTVEFDAAARVLALLAKGDLSAEL
nr:D-amino acid dehydrogenase 3 small subunit [Bradyrhizobium sp. DOA9]